MKCPNCGKDVGTSKVCPDCGAEVIEAQSNEKVFEPANGGENTGKKKGNAIVIIGLVVIIAVIAVAIYYFLQMNTSRYIFDKKIDEFLTMDSENSDYKTMKLNADLQFSVDSNNESAKTIADLINDATFSFNTEVDLENKEEIIGLKIDKSKDEILDIKAKLESETQEMYMTLGQLFDKTIKMDIEEVADEKFEMADVTSASFGQEIMQGKANSILKKEVKAQLKDEYFSKEEATINDEKVDKNILKLTGKEFADVMKNTCKNLSENEEFIGCYKDGEEAKANLQEIYDAVEDLDVNEDATLTIAVFTKGFNKEVKRVDISVIDEDSTFTVELTKVNDEEYDYVVKVDDKKAFDGKIKFEMDEDNFKCEITFVGEDGTKVTYKINGNIVYNEPLSDFDTNNTIDYNDLTQEDAYKVVGNFMNSKLYEIVQNFSNSDLTLDKSDIDDGDDEEDEDNKKDEKNQNEEKKDDDESLSNNSLITYNEAKIKFDIPSGYECYSSDNDHYKLFEKELDDGEISVDVSIEYNSLDEYLSSKKEQWQEREKEENYANINISDIEEIEVKGNKFKKLTVKYDYGFDDNKSTYTQYYVAHEIDSDNLYTIEVEGNELIEEKDLKTFLTIKE